MWQRARRPWRAGLDLLGSPGPLKNRVESLWPAAGKLDDYSRELLGRPEADGRLLPGVSITL